MRSPQVYFPGELLSAAELSAACLDGVLVELGEGYVPADAVETGALRAATLARLTGGVLAVTRASAAWVFGAASEPSRHFLQRAVPYRIHHRLGRRFHYRDPAIPQDDLLTLGGVAVTTPERTVADLLRSRTASDDALAQELCAAMPGTAIATYEWLRAWDERYPNKRTALRRAAALCAREGVRKAQEDVTRYTS